MLRILGGIDSEDNMPIQFFFFLIYDQKNRVYTYIPSLMTYFITYK